MNIEKTLQIEIKELEDEDNPFEKELLENKKQEPITLRTDKLKRHFIGPKAKWVEEGENLTSYFVILNQDMFIVNF